MGMNPFCNCRCAITPKCIHQRYRRWDTFSLSAPPDVKLWEDDPTYTGPGDWMNTLSEFDWVTPNGTVSLGGRVYDIDGEADVTTTGQTTTGTTTTGTTTTSQTITLPKWPTPVLPGPGDVGIGKWSPQYMWNDDAHIYTVSDASTFDREIARIRRYSPSSGWETVAELKQALEWPDISDPGYTGIGTMGTNRTTDINNGWLLITAINGTPRSDGRNHYVFGLYNLNNQGKLQNLYWGWNHDYNCILPSGNAYRTIHEARVGSDGTLYYSASWNATSSWYLYQHGCPATGIAGGFYIVNKDGELLGRYAKPSHGWDSDDYQWSTKHCNLRSFDILNNGNFIVSVYGNFEGMGRGWALVELELDGSGEDDSGHYSRKGKSSYNMSEVGIWAFVPTTSGNVVQAHTSHEEFVNVQALSDSGKAVCRPSYLYRLSNPELEFGRNTLRLIEGGSFSGDRHNIFDSYSKGDYIVYGTVDHIKTDSNYRLHVFGRGYDCGDESTTTIG